VFGILKQAINVLIISILMLSTPAIASIGSITESKGAGQIKRQTKTLPAAKGTGVQKNDTVSTTSQGRFKITFIDSTTVNITENSRLVIDDFVFDGGGKSKGRLGLKVALGTVRYASGGVAKGNPKGVNIRTPTATIGVRGTDFMMSVDEIGRTMVVLLPNCFDDKDITKIVTDCPTGEIEIATAAGTVVINQPFMASVVENSSTPPSPPAKIDLTMKQLDNNLQIAAPASDGGDNIVNRSRRDNRRSTNPAAAASEDNAEPDLGIAGNAEENASVTIRQATSEELLVVFKEFNEGNEPTEPIYTRVSPAFRKQLQVGWYISSLTDAKLQSADVLLPRDTRAQVVFLQDNQITDFNFADHRWPTTGTGLPDGNITIIQRSGASK
jgi:hypothetical protein